MDFATTILPSVFASLVLGAIALVLRTMARGLKTYLDDEIRARLVPNGGSSLADRMSALEKDVREIKNTVQDQQACMNPNCPERYSCEHMPPVRNRFRRARYG